MLPEGIDWKTVAALASVTLSIAGSIPYFHEIFKGRTKPHAYTWLIWTLTMGIAAASVWRGGAGILITLSMIASLTVCLLTFLLSFRYGTKNITRGDTTTLIVALLAIFVWVVLDEPLLGLFMAAGIDFIGYWPTYRKSLVEPWSESLASWSIYTLAPIASLLALLEYNALTITYSAMTFTANCILLILLLIRRKKVSKPA